MRKRNVPTISTQFQKFNEKAGTNKPAQILTSHACKHSVPKPTSSKAMVLERSFSKSSVVLVSTGDQREWPKSLQTDCRSNVRSRMPAYDCFSGSGACIKPFNGANNRGGHPPCCRTLYVHHVLSWKPFMVARRARKLVWAVARSTSYGILPIVHPINKPFAELLHG